MLLAEYVVIYSICIVYAQFNVSESKTYKQCARWFVYTGSL